jgi:YHS domain-containing protein
MKMRSLIALVLISLVGSSAPMALAQGSAPRSATAHDRGPDMQTIHQLFAHHQAIRRSVKLLPTGVETLTEASDPKVASLLQAHVAAMKARLVYKRPIREWDPLFAAIFAHADQIKLETINTTRGVRIVETSSDPSVVKLIQADAQAISDFIQDGPAGMSKRHELPGLMRTAQRGQPRFLGRGDGITTCPVTGEPVNKSVEAVINGRTIYFCCASCIATVQKNPALYLKPPAH